MILFVRIDGVSTFKLSLEAVYCSLLDFRFFMIGVFRVVYGFGFRIKLSAPEPSEDENLWETVRSAF